MTIKLKKEGCKFLIYIGNEMIGYAEKKEGHTRWHSVLNVPGSPALMRLAQGFGDTVNDSINNAFKKTEDDVAEFVVALAALKNRMKFLPTYDPDK